ncbi:hypothetical protein PMIN06_000646 [Paraphaeosphaeria minitans]|uniref:Uncharacterized protein n=1 Tax=Paraphaeosphaeria minitans TaxID=565426 RepID=A0A9P6GGF2_9PLEO|nr:hypothetical protein PMIN01_06677 [Paraphaeosphaeria minitans]
MSAAQLDPAFHQEDSRARCGQMQGFRDLASYLDEGCLNGALDGRTNRTEGRIMYVVYETAIADGRSEHSTYATSVPHDKQYFDYGTISYDGSSKAL